MSDDKVPGQVDPRVGFGFLMTELQTGQVFASIALSAGDDVDKASRNQDNARKAYDTILQFRDRVQIGDQQVQNLEAGLKQLRVSLRKLGEDL